MKKVVLGPFATVIPSLSRTVFKTFEEALVPRTEVRLDNDRILKILAVKPSLDVTVAYVGSGAVGFSLRGIDRLYYVVYMTDRLDFYQPYLARLPREYEEVTELRLPRCPKCGSWTVGIDADEMYCEECGATDFWHTDVVWKAKDLPLEGLAEGEGIYIVPPTAVDEYVSAAGHAKVREVKRLAEGEEKLGNVLTHWVEFQGYVDESHWDEEPVCYGFAVYRRYVANFGDVEKGFVVKVRDLSIDEMVVLFDELRDDFAQLCLTRFLLREKAVELTLRARLYEKYPLQALVDDPRVREAYISHKLELMRKAMEKGDVKDAAYYASLLRNVGYEDEETREVLVEYEKAKEEERRRREEEKRRREKEREMKVREIRERFAGLPVEVRESFGGIEVRLTKRVGKDKFNMFVKICRELGFRYDWKSKSWFINVG
ncbi:MAG: hypothetical protein QW794_04185 [Thermosphaera sp.]